MRKKFIVNIDGEITEQSSNAFLTYLKENNLLWWHWLSNTWLIVAPDGNIEINILRDKTTDIFQKNNLVLEIKEDIWSGYGPRGAKTNMFTWIKEQWE
ncbi:hypothetical protein [Bacteroides eggerthii]|jgi:hypothetical protein|uniref:hypothetical protein n=1 Tax=Bacteroides eggerthii TaxID=28111 RepID=UPI000E511833|nr:hypothetical protein [Bacteroides eggerthii]RHI73320.1 hypothetical protein DW157_10070 [Bacteroides eggerthii]